jgi:hypothetical protein
MNEQRFDEIFREKLTGYSEMPSPEAGKKLSKKLKERKRSVWIQFTRLAAALTLIAVSVYVVQSWNDTPSDELAQQTTSSIVPAKNVEEQIPQTPTALSVNPSSQEFSISKTAEPSIEKNSEEPSTNNVTPPEPQPVSVVTTPTLALTNEHDDLLKDERIGDLLETEQDSELETKNLKPSKPKVTITYKRSPASPEPTLALQDSSEYKTKGLKKLWRKAQNLRYNDISLAGIRGTKDQILAFDRKDKNKESKSN